MQVLMISSSEHYTCPFQDDWTDKIASVNLECSFPIKVPVGTKDPWNNSAADYVEEAQQFH